MAKIVENRHHRRRGNNGVMAKMASCGENNRGEIMAMTAQQRENGENVNRRRGGAVAAAYEIKSGNGVAAAAEWWQLAWRSNGSWRRNHAALAA